MSNEVDPHPLRTTDDSQLIFIVGPTASGKSDLALRVAKQFDGEIICADSQTIRRGMDIGTAKPTADDRQQVPHHLLDIIDPYDRFTVAEFKTRAEAAIADIQTRGKVPIIVGGTGLYIDALLYGFSFRATSHHSQNTREQLESKPVEELQKMIHTRGLTLPKNEQNPRHLIRVIETAGAAPRKQPLRSGALVIGIDPGRERLEARIKKRIEYMLEHGFLDELKSIVNTYGTPDTTFDAIEYRIAYEHPNATEQELKEMLLIGDRQYAKKQRTWFRRNTDITWFETAESAFEYVTNSL